MSYIYDIVLNFNKIYYEFYEWKDTDKILNFRKIPLFKISNNDYISIKYDDVKLDSTFIDVIYDCAYLVGNSNKVTACLFSNGSEVMGLKLDNDGNILGKSSLLLDEEEEVLEDIISSNIYRVKYEVIKKCKNNILSRVICDKKEYLTNFFNNDNELNLYKYIYYDFFEEEENDIVKIKKKLFNIISNDWNNDCDKLYESVRVFDRVR